MLGPRINASGRISSGMEALELIMSEDREIARECARIVDQHNNTRKSVEQKMVQDALAKVVAGAPAQVIDLPDGHPGVSGIIAARVMENLSSRGCAVPVCIVADGRGSARSPAGINIRDAMEYCADCLVRFGGHAAAGGFSVKPGMIDAFRDKLCEYCREVVLRGQYLADNAKAMVDVWVEPKDLTLELAQWVMRMEPFGEGNPEPVFGLRNVEFADIKPMGMDGRHLSVVFRNRLIPRAVWWNHGEKIEELRSCTAAGHDIAFKLTISEYGQIHVELRLVSVFD